MNEYPLYFLLVIQESAIQDSHTWKQENRWSNCSAEKSQASLANKSWIFFTIASCLPIYNNKILHYKNVDVPNTMDQVQSLFSEAQLKQSIFAMH